MFFADNCLQLPEDGFADLQDGSTPLLLADNNYLSLYHVFWAAEKLSTIRIYFPSIPTVGFSLDKLFFCCYILHKANYCRQ